MHKIENIMTQVDKRLLELPKQIYIDITNKCNLKCQMCPQGHGLVENKGNMTFELFEKIIEDITSFENYRPSIALHVTGEPLLHKRLVDMVALASKRNLYTFVHTNGLLLDRVKGQQLVDAGISEVSVSFEGESPSNYEKIRVNSDHAKVKYNIREFLKIRKNVRVVVEVLKFRGIDRNIAISEQFKNEFPGAEFSSFYASDWRGTLSSSELCEKGILDKKPDVCRDMRNVFVIAWDGKVRACCIDYNSQEIIGDMNEQNLKQVWFGTKRMDLLKLMAAGRHREIDLCKNCSAPYTTRTKERNRELSQASTSVSQEQ